MAIFKKLKSFFTKKNKKEDNVSLEKNKEVEFSKTNLKSDQKKRKLIIKSRKIFRSTNFN